MFLVELNWLQDAEFLGRLGRDALAVVLERLAPLLAQQGKALPDASLPDVLYFPKLAAVLRAQSIKLAIYLAPTAGSAAPSQPAAFADATPLPTLDPVPYALYRDGPLWHLTFHGRPAVLKHEKGLCYVAEMLSHPGQPIKKLSLAVKYSAPRSAGSGGVEVFDPASGHLDLPSNSEAVHELSLAADDLEARRVCQARGRQLAETIRDPKKTKAVREEARAELEQITAYLAKDRRQLRDATKAAGDAVRSAIQKLLRNLVAGSGSASGPGSVQREFARHLQRHLLIPSGRYAGPKARKARGELTGCLLYEPPPGVVWIINRRKGNHLRKRENFSPHTG
jgi:plasmid stabilization system protein ParE